MRGGDDNLYVQKNPLVSQHLGTQLTHENYTMEYSINGDALIVYKNDLIETQYRLNSYFILFDINEKGVY